MTRQSDQHSQHQRRAASPGAWSYTAGEKGKNRVRLFERHGHVWIDYRTETGGRVRQSLGHANRDRAKQQADDIVAKFRRAGTRGPAAVTLARLFEMYEAEVIPGKSRSGRDHGTRTLPLFLTAFGAERRPVTLNIRDWDSYIGRRRKGEIAPPGREGKPVRAAVLSQDVKLLLAVLNWATRAGDGHGGYLLDRNPLKGLTIPREESPRRPILAAEQFEAARTKAAEMSPTAELFVCLLWFTGHRAASVRQLRWTDIDLTSERVLWRADVDKINYEHRNPLHPELVPLLAQGKAVAELTGEALLFPDPKESSQAMTRYSAFNLWRRIADAADIPRSARLGTHAFRRAFANRLRDANLRDLKDLGGWKTEKTVIEVYLQPDEAAQRAALERLTTK